MTNSTHHRGLRLLAVFLLLPLGALACRSVAVTDRNEYEGARLPRPDTIWIYDFASSPEELPSFSKERQAYADRHVEQSAKTLEAAHKLGAKVTEELIAHISEMGLSARRAQGDPPDSAQNDIVLVGAFTTVKDGSAVERVAIGFGEGAPTMNTYVAGYRQTDAGLVELGSGNTGSKSSKGPGLVVPALVTVATANPIGLLVGGTVKAGEELSGASTIEGTAKRTAEKISSVLEEKFREQGWIQ